MVLGSVWAHTQVHFFEVLSVFARHLPSSVSRSVREYLEGVMAHLEEDVQRAAEAGARAMAKGSQARDALAWAVGAGSGGSKGSLPPPPSCTQCPLSHPPIP
jgi:hypothetical protein